MRRFLILVLLIISITAPSYATDLTLNNTPAQVYFSPKGGCTDATFRMEINRANSLLNNSNKHLKCLLRGRSHIRTSPSVFPNIGPCLPQAVNLCLPVLFCFLSFFFPLLSCPNIFLFPIFPNYLEVRRKGHGNILVQ